MYVNEIYATEKYFMIELSLNFLLSCKKKTNNLSQYLEEYNY